MGFRQLTTTRKGTAGEAVARDYFIRQGRLPYSPDVDGPHVIDFMIYNPDRGGVTAVDVKTYPRWWSGPMTGLDTADLETYRQLQQTSGLAVYLIFVDAFEQAIYGASLSDLPQPDRSIYPKSYYYLTRFTLLHRLASAELKRLGPLKDPTRYIGVARHFSTSYP